MLKSFARSVSILIHPLFIVSYVFLYLVTTNPYLFGFSGAKAKGLVTISVITISLMFPLISILMMKALGLIKSLEMEDKNERIGPLVITGMFYMWLYVNIRNNDLIPNALSFFILGSTIALFIALIINSFTKISLHTIGAGGLVTAMILIIYNWSYGSLIINMSFFDIQFIVDDRLLLYLIIILAGCLGASRLYLKAHSEDEIYGGYLVGIVSQMIAFRIFF